MKSFEKITGGIIRVNNLDKKEPDGNELVKRGIFGKTAENKDLLKKDLLGKYGGLLPDWLP